MYFIVICLDRVVIFMEITETCKSVNQNKRFNPVKIQCFHLSHLRAFSESKNASILSIKYMSWDSEKHFAHNDVDL